MTCKRPWKKDGYVLPCGHCMPCRVRRKEEWTMRLLHELDRKSACFVTLTYSPENCPASLQVADLQRFFKRLRKDVSGIKYYAVGEYGDSFGRPHYHAIVFGLSGSEAGRVVRDNWSFGFVKVGSCTVASIHYVTGYVTKKIYGEKSKDAYGDNKPPFAVMSRGLGLDWAKAHVSELSRGYVIRHGVKVAMPRYYGKKLELGDMRREGALLASEAKRRAVAKLTETSGHPLQRLSQVEKVVEALDKKDEYDYYVKHTPGGVLPRPAVAAGHDIAKEAYMIDS